MRNLIEYFTVFVGAGIGGALRHAIGRLPAVASASWPWGTLLINVAGCLAVGVVAGAFASSGQAAPLTRLFLTVGLLGGFTTFSAFALDTVLIWERGQHASALAYVTASVVLSLAGALGGLALMRAA